MIPVINGDLMQAPQHIIGHQVNCQGVMGSGVARQIRKVYPKAYDEYLKAFVEGKSNLLLLGLCQMVNINEDKMVANLFTQLDFNRNYRNISKNKSINKSIYTDYEAFYTATKYLSIYSRVHNYTVALPYKIGCARGGGDWNLVYKILENNFANQGRECNLTLYKMEE